LTWTEDPMTQPRTPRPPAEPAGERLQKYMARCGIASRRAAEDLIAEGRVEVNGEQITEPGRRVDAEVDEVRLDGERLRPVGRRVVLLLNKPVGYLSAQSDPENRPLVYRLLPKDLALRSIGRLDFNTEGVLLFTNDGDLAERLGHPRYSIQRTYEARVRGVPTPEVLAALCRGVRLDDGPARAESAEVVKSTGQNAWVRLVLVEGRNREVRRLMERVGHPVVRLRRVAFAGLTAEGLRPGEWRMLEAAEIEQLEGRGHVGGFEMPPDPRRGGGTRTRIEEGRKPPPEKVVVERTPTRRPSAAPRGAPRPPRSRSTAPRTRSDALPPSDDRRPARSRPATGAARPAAGPRGRPRVDGSGAPPTRRPARSRPSAEGAATPPPRRPARSRPSAEGAAAPPTRRPTRSGSRSEGTAPVATRRPPRTRSAEAPAPEGRRPSRGRPSGGGASSTGAPNRRPPRSESVPRPDSRRPPRGAGSPPRKPQGPRGSRSR
jgi:23S rRNA pseudouridine2605 synthase